MERAAVVVPAPVPCGGVAAVTAPSELPTTLWATYPAANESPARTSNAAIRPRRFLRLRRRAYASVRPTLHYHRRP